ncbi:MAG: ribosome silencing factor [Alphaproteobacteria bacterium]|nr:MAG: ribosome silencing factor [Alphaproteobacteria bacterium]
MAQKAENVLAELVLDSLDEDKAQGVVAIDLAGKTSFADFMVIASGRSHRHVSAISDHLIRRIKESGYGRCRVEGLPHCDWVLIDAGDVIVHIFRPEVREFYNLEKMWSAELPAERLAI